MSKRMKLTGAQKRLMMDLKILQREAPAGVSAVPTKDNVMLWNAVIFGPADTPFEDGAFKLSLKFADSYPHKAPEVKFLSSVFHPNVYNDGGICLDTLQNNWSPQMTIGGILISVQSLLDEPNPKSPANSEAARLFQEDKIEYEKRVWKCVEESWKDIDNEDDDNEPMVD
eukprot:m.28415 g.28415  ORF g.28415 m.28415 type:complete len:170 (-) comp15912_c0_seq1:127-636(-)